MALVNSHTYTLNIDQCCFQTVVSNKTSAMFAEDKFASYHQATSLINFNDNSLFFTLSDPSSSSSFFDHTSNLSLSPLSVTSSLEYMRSHPDQENLTTRRHRKRREFNHQVPQRTAANLRERRRMKSINDAFEVSVLDYVTYSSFRNLS